MADDVSCAAITPLPAMVQAAHELVVERQAQRSEAWRESPALIGATAVMWADAMERLRRSMR